MTCVVSTVDCSSDSIISLICSSLTWNFTHPHTPTHTRNDHSICAKVSDWKSIKKSSDAFTQWPPALRVPAWPVELAPPSDVWAPPPAPPAACRSPPVCVLEPVPPSAARTTPAAEQMCPTESRGDIDSRVKNRYLRNEDTLTWVYVSTLQCLCMSSKWRCRVWFSACRLWTFSWAPKACQWMGTWLILVEPNLNTWKHTHICMYLYMYYI